MCRLYCGSTLPANAAASQHNPASRGFVSEPGSQSIIIIATVWMIDSSGPATARPSRSRSLPGFALASLPFSMRLHPNHTHPSRGVASAPVRASHLPLGEAETCHGHFPRIFHERRRRRRPQSCGPLPCRRLIQATPDLITVGQLHALQVAHPESHADVSQG